MIYKYSFLLLLILFCNCGNDDSPNTVNPVDIPNPDEDTLYFPPVNNDEWATSTVEALNWNTNAVQNLYTFLEERDTKAFILLKNGSIVMEKYFNGGTITSLHPWNSIGKSLTAFTVGVAQQEGLIDISMPSSTYLGDSWANMSAMQLEQIKVKDHLCMTTGVTYTIEDTNCTDPECLTYQNPPGSFWYYHTATSTLLTDMVANASDMGYNDYFANRIKDRIGMTGNWVDINYNRVYFSNARSLARFGLLVLNKGVWDTTPILTDRNYFDAMLSTSQDQNKAYGYLWWLNGKTSLRLPASEMVFPSALLPEAPDDLIAGLGRNDQKLYIIPSQNIVIVRLGDKGSDQVSFLGPSSFDNELWQYISNILPQS